MIQFKCKVCSYTTKSNYYFKAHERLHLENKLPVRCTICNEAFPDEEELLHHEVEKHNEEYECQVCGKAFSDKRRALRHIKNHDKERGVVWGGEYDNRDQWR